MTTYFDRTLSRSVFGHIIVSSLTILSLPLVPIVLLLLLLGYLFRSVIKAYVKCFRPELGKILPLCGSIFRVERPGKPCENSIFLNFILKGSVNFEKFRSDILVKVNEKNSQGDLKYPELQQFGSTFAGYSFWKWDKCFDIKNHLHLGYKGCTRLDLDTLNTLVAEEMRQPYSRSPWEVFVFPDFNFKSGDQSVPRSAVIVRYNHVLMDGNTMIELLGEASGIRVPPRSSKNTGRSIGWKLVSRTANALLFPYQMIGFVYDNWDGPLLKCDSSRSLIVRFSQPIPLSIIKDLKNKLSVSFGAILIAAYTGGLRKLMLENKITLPVALHSVMPMPMLGHSNKLRNKMKFGNVTMPVGISDPGERLAIIESQQRTMTNSRIPSQMHYTELAYGLLPPIFMKIMLSLMPLSGMISNFSNPLKGLSYHEHSVEHLFGAIGLYYRNAGFSICTISFEESVILGTSYIKSSVLNGNPEVFLNGILEELKSLADIVHPNGRKKR